MHDRVNNNSVSESDEFVSKASDCSNQVFMFLFTCPRNTAQQTVQCRLAEGSKNIVGWGGGKDEITPNLAYVSRIVWMIRKSFRWNS